VLARQVGQGAGLGPREVGAVAGGAHRARHHVAAEGARRQEHDLPVGQVRCERARDVLLRERGRGHQNQLGAAHRGADVGGGERQRHLAPAAEVAQHDAPRFGDRRERRGVAPPEPDLVSLLGQVGRRSVAAVPATQNRDTHPVSSRAGPVGAGPSSRLPSVAAPRCRLRPRRPRPAMPAPRRRSSPPGRAPAACPRRTPAGTATRCARRPRRPPSAACGSRGRRASSSA